jgi:alpha-amylase
MILRNRKYPIYSPSDFHHDQNNQYSNCIVKDYTNKTNVQFCDLDGMPDLYTASSTVQSTIAAYLNRLASMGAQGIRVDAAKHQDASELKGILNRLPSNFYVGQEVIGSPGEAIQPSMYYANGQVTEFSYSPVHTHFPATHISHLSHRDLLFTFSTST